MQILEKIRRTNILVVGDVMLDRYWWGSVDRISPEAPVPIVRMEKTSLVAGGAANVAANLIGLGAEVTLFGAKGDDSEGGALDEVLTTAGIDSTSVFSIAGRRTSIKTRIVAHSQHVVRIDSESTETITQDESEMCWSAISKSIGSCDAVIISDYAKGFLTDALLENVISAARAAGKLVLVDPKGKDFSKYRGASIITPNKREAAEAAGVDLSSTAAVHDSGQKLLDGLDLDGLLITEGEDGMTLFEKGKEPRHFSSIARNVYDVTGAGDTVIATFAAAAAAGAPFADAADLANAAAGLVVGKIGTTRITTSMLAEYYSDDDLARHSNA